MSQSASNDAASTAPPVSVLTTASAGRSILSSLGIAQRSTPRSPALSQQQQQHRSFLETQLLPVIYKLQKEVGWRKYKDCQAPLQEAVLALKAFQQQAWPPSIRDSNMESTMEHPPDHTTTTTTESLQYNVDDPQTREDIHEAIRVTAEALILILQDPAKLPRPTELALDGITLLVAHRYVSGRSGSIIVAPTGEEAPDASLLTRLLDSIAKMSDSSHETVQTALLSTLTTIMTCTKCSIHENSMLTVVRCTFHIYLVTKSVTLKDSAKRALLDIIKAVFFRMEAYDAVCPGMSDASATGTSSDSSIGGVVVVVNPKITDVEESSSAALDPSSPTSLSTPKFASQYHADAYFLFRSLCKLSSKELPADMTDEGSTKAKPGRLLFPSAIPTDPTELNSKILSLELILIILEQYVGDTFVFHRNTKFIFLIQHYLCGSLLKNCISNHTHVAFLSQKIFLVLVYKFKSHLKQDIEVFMSNVFFRVLESNNTSFKQKALVLESLRSLCKDPILLTQIFLTYDCDFDAMNLYKDIVHMLTKLGGKATTSAPTSLSSKKDMEQEFELSLAAIECLVTILKAFLRALNLPSGDDSDIDTAGARIRSMIQLDSALAGVTTTLEDSAHKLDSDVDSISVATTEDGGAPFSAGVVNSDVAVKIVDAFDRKRNAEQNFQIGVVKFTLSLKNGLHFFIENGFVELHAKQVALFFINHKDKLDKTQMGEALGREPDAAFVKEKEVEADLGGPGFWVRILHHYTEALDFSGLVFDEAIRLFLSGFRLPGEAQKIDRIMEKFAERYTSQNPSIFPSSDTAFILGFSVIMLNTDLHNPSIKPEKRMTIDSFLRNNRGIGDNGSDLPDDVLKGIFERIKERPFSLKEDDAARERVGAQKHIFDTSLFFEGTNSLFGASAEDRKRENFKKERDEMMAVTEQLIRRRPDKNNTVVSPDKETNFNDDISPAEVVKPMFDVTWGPMLGILSQVLECADDERSVAVCLNGFVFAIRLAAHSQMSLVRDTFVSSLAKFTFLGSIKEMKRKNVESIRTLLSVAIIDGEYLGESWCPVLQCMSQLARLRLSASGLDSDDSFLMVENPKSASNPRSDATLSNIFRQSTPGDIAREAEESNGKAVLEAVHEILIDKVFSSTINLSAKSLALFVEQLIAVSSTEISGNSNGVIAGVEASKILLDKSKHGSGLSIFSLQRLVDVADYNMDIRPRLVWAQVWDLMADFFVRVTRHENRMVSIFAIDSLKQLSLKFLEKPELSEFNFQCSFLKPFLVVMEDKKSRDDIRELILQCIDNIIRAKSHNLKSGWKVMFSILTLSASDPVEKIEYLGLAILQRVLDDHLDDIFCSTERPYSEDAMHELSSLDKRNRNSHADDFVGLCKASLSFLQIEETDSLRPFGLSMRAFCHIAIYADLLASRRVLPPVTGAQWTDPHSTGYSYGGMSDKESLDLVLWRPLFQGLADGIRSSARTSASGVGCLVQRGSVLTFRAILLRHGNLFSSVQLSAILRETILPAIQFAVERDQSHVITLTSESPSISSIDFLVSPPPLPPSHDDPDLQRFGSVNATPNRTVGLAELLLEASFTDLRHGGDGDLRKSYLLAQKSTLDEIKVIEQAFPDSWIVTTAPLALGLITDLFTEIVVHRLVEGHEILWPLISQQFRLWAVGRVESPDKSDESTQVGSWFPCEAIVRITCTALYRLASRSFESLSTVHPSADERLVWASSLLQLFSNILIDSVRIEKAAKGNLLALKRELHLDMTNDDESFFETPYGAGRVVSVRNDLYTDPTSQLTKVIPMNIIELDFGAILYQPLSGLPTQTDTSQRGIPTEVDVPDGYWVHVVPSLKIRCVAAYCLHQSLYTIFDDLIPLASQDDVEKLLSALNESQCFAASATNDEEISMAFQEALQKDWGDGVQIRNDDADTIARWSLLHGSDIFFLAQEAGAAKAIIRMMALLYSSSRASSTDDWNAVAYAEPHLIRALSDVIQNFLKSEARDGHLVDPNLWRSVNENLGKVALYCTSFASVLVDVLKVIRSMRHEEFDKHKHIFFPSLCSLVQTQSGEIRRLVHEILILHVAPYLGIDAGSLSP